MNNLSKLTFISLAVLLSSGCTQQKPKPNPHTVAIPTQPINQQHNIPIATTYPIPQQQPIITPVLYPETVPTIVAPVVSQYIPDRTPYLQGAYAKNYKLKRFIEMMATKYNYDRYELNAIFSTVSRDTKALKKYNVYGKAKPTQSKATSVGSWDKYRKNFINSSHINKGVAFWRENAKWLNMAANRYGVAPEYIVGIIGVETNFGGYTGEHSVLNALTTLALEYRKRSTFFKSELENYLLMIRDERVHPQSIKGSYAGAFGLSQFMPSSFREYAIDLNGDGHIDLFNKADAIGSIANYFRGRGKWDPRIPVTMKTYYNKKRFYGLATGFKTSYSQRHLYKLGMRPSSNFYGYKGNVSLIKLSRYGRDELWWGTPNFRAITRYNPKDHYAMAVHQLGQAIKKAYYGR